MQKKLIDQSVKDLLNGFGAGSHIPGSGSAAALNGLTAVKLICTVIGLTEKYQNRSVIYRKNIAELLKEKQILESDTFSRLENLFEEDSIQFDKVIVARNDRDEEKDPILKIKKTKTAENELKKATEILVKIAELCFEVGKLAVKVFDYGFQAARGDSTAGLNNAFAGLSSCISIINLNLQKNSFDIWFENIWKQKSILEVKCKELEVLKNQCQNILEKEIKELYEIESKFSRFKSGNLSESLKSDHEIEKLVIDLQNTLWLNKEKIWKKESKNLEIATDILMPQDVLINLLNYSVLQKDSLGNIYDENKEIEVAGLIDMSKKEVQISRNFPIETMRFTLAHELGHAILHKGILLHRDRAIDGSKLNKNLQENQADKFAAFFLMPQKIVKQVFQEIFEMPVFKINENTILQLGEKNIEDFKRKCVDIHGLARKLVEIKRYGRKSINPIKDIFGVSTETMAIRLEELGLVEF